MSDSLSGFFDITILSRISSQSFPLFTKVIGSESSGLPQAVAQSSGLPQAVVQSSGLPQAVGIAASRRLALHAAIRARPARLPPPRRQRRHHQERHHRHLIQQPAPAAQGRIPQHIARDAQRQRPVQQGQMTVEPRRVANRDAHHGRDDHRRVAEHHREHVHERAAEAPHRIALGVGVLSDRVRDVGMRELQQRGAPTAEHDDPLAVDPPRDRSRSVDAGARIAGAAADLGDASLELVGVDVEGFSDAIHGNRVRAENVTVTGAGHGIRAARARVTNAVLDGNDNGLIVQRMARLENVSASGSATFGIDGGCKLRGTGVTANDNGIVGIDVSSGYYCSGSKIILDASQVTGNPVDLRARRRPHLSNTGCETSENPDDGSSWGVCAND